jgi:anti-anti-sigma regulatory factor
MPDNQKPVFLVDAYSDPAILRVRGKATYLNCTPVGPALEQLLRQGKREVVVDFENCQGMDSTFLGILAGAALQLRRADPPGNLTLCRLGPRNLELVRNLGLHRIAHVDESGQPSPRDAAHSRALAPGTESEAESTRIVLKAHENLVEADEGNERKFQDVIAFLKNQVEES